MWVKIVALVVLLVSIVGAVEECAPESFCILHYQCSKENKMAVTDGSDIFRPRAGGPETGNIPVFEVCKFPKVCCGVSNVNEDALKEFRSVNSNNQPPTVTPTATPNVTPTVTPTVIPTAKPTSRGRTVNPPTDVETRFNENTTCGWRNEDGVFEHRILSVDEDSKSEYGEFPWVVNLQINGSSGRRDCSGSIISPTVILTAAHCVRKPKVASMLVRAGVWDTHTKSEVLQTQERRVREKIVHRYYHYGALYNDIALLLLEEPLEWAKHVMPICLPPADQIFDGSRCYVAGWGRSAEGDAPSELHKVEVPVVPREQCQTQIRAQPDRSEFEVHESFICAGGEEGRDACKGDGGAPLMCPMLESPNRYYQAGLVSWGIDCGVKDVPSFYTNIANLRSWIDENISAEGISNSTFTP